MRIRGSVAQVLGSPSVFFPLSSLPISAPAAPPAEPTPHCELNCSPWDVDDDSMMEDEDGMAGETVDEQQLPAAASAAVTAETETSDKVEIKDEEMNKAIMEEDKQNVTDQNTAKKTCSKKGKGWKCTRPAELLHPFCLYHLTILRSYKSGRRPNSSANRLPSSSRSSARKRTWKKKAAAAAAAAAAVDPDSFVYYDLSVPGRGKRRDGSSGVKIKEDEGKSPCQKDPRFNALVVNGDEHAAEEPLTPKKANAKKMKSGIVYCKKNDGKGWSCKRPAALPSNFCSHHLSQMKAYSSNQYQNSKKFIEINSMATSDASKIKKPQTPTGTPHESKGKKQAISKKRKAATASSSSRLNDFYFSASNVKDFYYYGKYMPWRKKRGARAEALEAQAQAEEVQEEVLVKEVKELGEKKNSGRAEKFVKGIIDINAPPVDDEDDGYEVA